MKRTPRWARTIRFRLALNYGLVVFAFGSLLVGGLYIFQARQLNEPVVAEAIIVDREGERFVLLTSGERQRAELALFEREVNRRSLEELRRNSLVGVAALALISSGAGWSLAGTALRPVKAIGAVAKDISGSDLSRRIEMTGPSDELKDLADTFDGMLDRVQDAFEEQRRFVHEASHELRNPLAIARSNLELALTADGAVPEAAEDDDELRRAAVIAYRSTGRMSVLVDDLLEQARNGISELNQTPVDVNRLLLGLASEYRASASAANVRLDIEGVGDEPLEVVGDEPALRRAVVNLMANALRLVPSGSTVWLASRTVDGWVELEVRDEGPGIEPADHEAVFQRFWRGGDAGAGSGLGLSIVRRIVERHGGSVMVDSKVGEGARFVIRLPDQRGSSAKLGG